MYWISQIILNIVAVALIVMSVFVHGELKTQILILWSTCLIMGQLQRIEHFVSPYTEKEDK